MHRRRARPETERASEGTGTYSGGFPEISAAEPPGTGRAEVLESSIVDNSRFRMKPVVNSSPSFKPGESQVSVSFGAVTIRTSQTLRKRTASQYRGRTGRVAPRQDRTW